MSEVIVFTSGKGGVGKSNLCLNTALELTARQHRTCLFDGDLGLANVNILLGIDQEYTLDDVVFSHRSLDDILVHTDYGFDIIPGSSGAEQIANLDDAQLESLISALSGVGDYDYFLIDTASGISKSVMSFCMAARQIIIVITHEATSLTDAYALLKILSLNGYQGAVKILINNCESVPQAKKTYLRYKKVADKHLEISISPAGIILHDDHFERAVVQQKPLLKLFPESIGAQCVKAFVTNLTRTETGTKDERLADFWQRYLEQIKQDSDSSAERSAQKERVQPATGGRRGVYTDGRRYDVPQRLPDAQALTQPLVPDVSGLFRQVQLPTGFCSAPAFLVVVFRRMNYGETSGDELRELLIVDPALAAQALRLAAAREGSTALAHIHRLEQIVDGLDDQDIHALLLQAAIAGSVKAVDAQEELRLLRQWQESYRRAVFARELAATASFAFPEEAYLCGLFLKIDQFRATAEQADADVKKGQEAADILQAFGLGSMMCDAVRFSCYPSEQVKTGFDLVRIVHIAHGLASQTLQPDDAVIGEMLGVTAEQVSDALDKALTEVGATFDMLEMADSSRSDSEVQGKNYSLSGYLLDNLLTGTLMAQGGISTDLQTWALRLHRNCSLLFNMERVISFVLDDTGRCLNAVNYPGCFYADSLANFVVPIQNSTSLLSRAYTTGSLVIEDLQSDGNHINLGDRQLGRLLGDDVLVCIPLKYEGVTRGIIVCATGRTDLATVTALHPRLSSLGAHAAQELAALDESARTADDLN